MTEWETPLEEEIDWATPLESPKNSKTKGWPGVGQDLLALVKNSPHLLEQFGQNVINETPNQLAGVLEHPGRIPQGLFAGLVGVPHSIASLPPAIGNYLSQKEIISPEAAARIPKPPFNPHELAGLKEELPGDVLTGLIGGFAAGGPAGPAAVKGAGQIAKAAGKGAKAGVMKAGEGLAKGQLGQIYRGVSNQKTGEILKEGYKKDLAQSQKLYSNAFKTAESKGVKEIPHGISQKDVNAVKDMLPEGYAAKLDKAIKTNNFEDLHVAQSDLLKFSRMVKNRAEKNPELSSVVKDAGKKAREMSEKIQQSIARELLEKGGLDTLFNYIGAGEHYLNNVVPWLDLPSIKGAIKNPGQKGYRYAEHLPIEARAKKANAFLSGKGQEFPELYYNSVIRSPYMALLEALSGMGMFSKIIKE